MNILGAVATASTPGLLGAGFTLGPLSLVGMEVPELLDSLGGTQRTAVHEFPGGIKTIQTYGAFPPSVTFKGIFTGSTAFQRMVTVDRLRIAGALIPLIYAQFGYLGVITSFKATPKYQWNIPYTLTFEPQQDISNGVATIPAAVTPEVNLTNSLSNISALSSGTPFPLPTELGVPTNSFTSSVASALTQASGVVANVTSAAFSTLQTAAEGVFAAATPLLDSVEVCDRISSF